MFDLVPLSLGLLVVFIFSLGARSLKSFSRHKLESFCRRRNADARLDVIIKHHEDVGSAVYLARILLISLVLIVSSFHAVPVFGTKLVFFAAIVFLVVLTDFWLPRALTKLLETYVVYFGWFFWNVTATLLYPFLITDRLITIFFFRLAGYTEDADAFEEEIRTIVTEGHREGLLEGDAREMIEGVIELQDVTVSEIMTPRTEMKCVSDALSWDEMLQSILSTPHSRIPVYRETRDDIVGVIHVRNLLRELAMFEPDHRRPWLELMSAPLFIPETKPIDTLLQEFQNVQSTENEAGDRVRGHLAIVLDEYGGVAGIITLEDILEEIVGEITDEHDAIVTDEEIMEISSDAFIVLGKVRIDDINSQLDLHLPEEEDYDTVAGFIFSTLGHIPEEGESVDFEYDGKKVRLTAVVVARRRIEKVRIERNC